VSKTKRWTHDKPTVPGRYRMRDRVFGWGPIEVTVVDHDDGGPLSVLADMTDRGVYVRAVASWIEWRKLE
jgi:hypothetical protein